jgi:O-antigen ligase
VTSDEGVPKNAPILDDNWLGLLTTTGIVGVSAFAWMLVRILRRLWRLGRSNDDDRGWLSVTLAASIFAFGIGMALFDALGFIQVTFLFFILLGFGSALTSTPAPSPAPYRRLKAELLPQRA